MNNILVNSRTNRWFSYGSHKCINHVHSVANVALDYNAYFFNKNYGSVIHQDTSLVAWQQFSGQDLHSLVTNPNFRNPGGNWSNADLHIIFPSPVNAMGTTALTTAVDIDGDLRAFLSPVDIGADAGGDSTKTITGLSNLGIPGFNAVVFPNPFTRNATLAINSPVFVTMTITIYSSYGQPVCNIKQGIVQGTNNIQLTMLNPLPAGTYFLKIDTGKESTATRIIKR